LRSTSRSAIDVAIVTGLVRFSGGGESIFVFLYVPVAVYAALLYGRRTGYAAAVSAASAYGLVLVTNAGTSGLPLPEALRVAMWGAQASALLLVVLLSNALMGERDRVRRALSERTRDLRSLQRLHARTVESLNSGLATTDTSGCITSFNPEAERITELDAVAALGLPLEEILPGASEVFHCDDQQRTQIEIRHPTGSIQYIGLSSSTLRSESGAGDGHVVIFQDVTRIVEMEHALRRGERMAALGELAARLAHEVRNPLAAISGSIEMLEHVHGDPTDASRLREIVLRETERLDHLITDFLQYARPAPPRAVRVELAPVVDEIAAMLATTRAQGPEGPVRHGVACDVETGLAVRADEGQLRQVLWNLCRNAIEAMPEGGDVMLSASSQAGGCGGRNDPQGRGTVEISVADTGFGIPEEEIDRVFEPFFTTKKQGTGLGLATVHRIVESNAGEISVESQPGSGTRFQIRLPAADRDPS
jgi:two-component system sensor histidine kinase PilS (NtrC family)